jgi:hypothetical protein
LLVRQLAQVRSQQPLVRRHALLDLQHLRLLSLD